jgi:hypothetical protein
LPVRPLFAVSALTIALTGIASAQMPSDIPAAPAQVVTTSGTVAAGITPIRYHAPVPGSAALIATLPGVTPPKAPIVPVIAPITAPVTPPVAAPVKTKAKPAPRTPPTSQTKSVRPESGAATRTAIRTLAGCRTGVFSQVKRSGR